MEFAVRCAFQLGCARSKRSGHIVQSEHSHHVIDLSVIQHFDKVSYLYIIQSYASQKKKKKEKEKKISTCRYGRRRK